MELESLSCGAQNTNEKIKIKQLCRNQDPVFKIHRLWNNSMQELFSYHCVEGNAHLKGKKCTFD